VLLGASLLKSCCIMWCQPRVLAEWWWWWWWCMLYVPWRTAAFCFLWQKLQFAVVRFCQMTTAVNIFKCFAGPFVRRHVTDCECCAVHSRLFDCFNSVVLVHTRVIVDCVSRSEWTSSADNVSCETLALVSVCSYSYLFLISVVWVWHRLH